MMAIIGGTGLSEFHAGNAIGSSDTPYGAISTAIVSSIVAGKNVLFLARHGKPHNIPPHKINYRANLWALKQLGVEQIVAVNAVGGINSAFDTGALVIPDQIIDYSYGREHTYFDGSANTLQHIDFSYPFTESLRQRLIAAATGCSLTLHGRAAYGVTQGPRLESSAEIKRMHRDGCDIVGMTAMPEAGLARELDIDYVSLCLVVNPAAGCSDELITMAAIDQVIKAGMVNVRKLLSAVIATG